MAFTATGPTYAYISEGMASIYGEMYEGSSLVRDTKEHNKQPGSSRQGTLALFGR
jgi:hypothetical protein